MLSYKEKREMLFVYEPNFMRSLTQPQNKLDHFDALLSSWAKGREGLWNVIKGNKRKCQGSSWTDLTESA